VSARWFVQTRGSLPSEDYTWCAIGAAGPDGADGIIARGYRGRGCFSLVDNERPGMLLYDDGGNGTVLLVTGLVSPVRPVDYQGREIRLNLLGVAAPGHERDQRALIAVAVSALRDKLTSDLIVSYGTAGGFSVDQERWSGFVEQTVTELAEMAEVEADPKKIAVRKDTDHNRDKTAGELGGQYRQVGQDLLADRLVILHTNILDAPDIGRLRAWRTISDIHASSSDYVVRSPLGAAAATDLMNAGKAIISKLPKRPGLLLSVLALAGIAVAFTLVSLSCG
jgi:hypothetical protein